MDTRKKILDAALTLFSQKGYGDVYVGEIADAVGIKAPSLYKHFKSKQDIFDAIIVEMQERYAAQANSLRMNGNNIAADSALFSAASEDFLVQTGVGLFLYFLHDDYVRRFRKMLTLEQFHDSALSNLYAGQYFDEPLAYQSAMFGMICSVGKLKAENSDVMALQFYAPIYLLLTECDRHPEREPELVARLEQHIRQFNRIYTKENAE